MLRRVILCTFSSKRAVFAFLHPAVRQLWACVEGLPLCPMIWKRCKCSRRLVSMVIVSTGTLCSCPFARICRDRPS